MGMVGTRAGVQSGEIRLTKRLYPEGKEETNETFFFKLRNDVLRCGYVKHPHGCMWRIDGRGARVEAGEQAGCCSHLSER